MEAVLNWLWQGGVVAAAAAVMLLALERARANLRYLVCWAALLAVVALPALPSIQLTAAPIGALRPSPGAAMISLQDTSWAWTLVLPAAWMAWASVHLLRLAFAVAAIRRARVRGTRFPSHLESTMADWGRVRATGRGATLVVSESVITAAVLGCGAPMIAVSPSLITTLDAGELDRVLIHEWAHVQRRDDLVNILQIVVRAFIGWHPAVWWIDRRLHVEREIACDEMTVAITGSPKTYAQCLVKLASVSGTARTVQAAPAVLTSRGLRARIIKIVSAPPSIAPVWSRTIAVASVGLLCLMSTGLAGLKLVETATVLALPIVSPGTRTTTAPLSPATAVPASSTDTETARRPKSVTRLPAARRQQAEHAPTPQSTVTSGAPASVPAGRAAESAIPAAPHPEPLILPVLTSVPPIPPEGSGMTAQKPRAPWLAAADGGVAIGRKSKDAGVATAGVFTRFGRRVAGAF